ncbi:MAG: ferrous iron transport protein B [Candidatus Odinarchaeota archaeon]
MKQENKLDYLDNCSGCVACNFCNPLGKRRIKKTSVDFRIDKAVKMDKVKMIFIGQPNVGKSSLLNALVGTKIMVSNYPGTSVEIMESNKTMSLYVKNKDKIQETEYSFKDTPGIYSISDHSSAEETITKKSILENNYDIIIMIMDATALERSLYFALQVQETGQKIVLGLNFNEEANKKGIIINSKKLSKIIGIPVVKFNPITKHIEDLIITATKQAEKPSEDYFTVKYDDHIEQLIDFISDSLDSDFSDRFISIRILEEDPDFMSYLPDNKKAILNEMINDISDKHQNIKEEISKTRYGTAAFISEQVTRIVKIGEKDVEEKSKLDRILLHRIWGPISTLLIFVGIFYVLLVLGGYIEDFFITIGDFILELIPKDGWTIQGFSYLDLIREGLAGAFAGIAIALPYVLLFYLLLGFMEDVGLLPRLVVNIQKLFDYLGLPSKGFISLILGLGCTVPAFTSTRILNRRIDRIKIAFIFAFIPCSSRIGIIMGIVGFYGGFLLALMVFGTLLIAMLIWAFLMKLILKVKPEPMLIELPTYRKPLINNVFSKSWLRMKGFVKLVIPLLIIGGVVFSIFNQLGVTNFLIEPFGTLIRFLFDLPEETIVPLVFGFVQKDLTGAMLFSVLGNEDGSLPLTAIQLYTFGAAACIGIPCIIALGAMFRERKFRDSLLIFFSVLLYGILVVSISWRILILFV